MSYSPVTMADILAEKQTDRRGFCPNCRRAEVPINPEGVCAPCTLTPNWHTRTAPQSLAELLRVCFATPKDRA